MKFLRAAHFNLQMFVKNCIGIMKWGKKFETYTTSVELIEKLDYFLEHDDERNTDCSERVYSNDELSYL